MPNFVHLRSPAGVFRLLFLGAVVALAAGSVARAEQQFAYEFSLSASKPLLLDPDNHELAMIEAWKLPSDLANQRNNPWFLLKNTSADAELNRFTMTIGDIAFRFSLVTPGEKQGNFTVAANIISGGNKIELLFDDFDPGEYLLVQFQLRPDDPDVFQYPDFRTVLFDPNGNSTADNSVLTAKFYDPVANVGDKLTGTLPDYPIDGPLFVAPTVRSYASQMDMVYIFDFNQQDNIPPVPEPASAVLWLIGTAGLGLSALKHRALRRHTARLAA